MNYYQFHIGDFRSGTVNMGRKARWIYRDMIDVYYDTEQPLPSDMDVLCDMLGVDDADERLIVERHLRFKFEFVDGAYRHQVCDSVIAEYHSKADVARANGKKGGRPRNNPVESQNNPAGSVDNQDETGLKTNHKPLTNNQEPFKSSSDQAAPDNAKAPAVPFQKIMDAYCQALPNLPQPQAMTEKRKTALRGIWREFEKCHSDDFWQRYFAYVGKSEFLVGMRGIGIDWLINKANFYKVIEGNYHA